MNKIYVFALMMLIAPLTGCIETEETDDIPGTGKEKWAWAWKGLDDYAVIL